MTDKDLDASLKRLLVDGEKAPDWFTLDSRIEIALDGRPVIITGLIEPGRTTDDQRESLRRSILPNRWGLLGSQRDPGDETDAT